MKKRFFWLHIKKSAGNSLKSDLLSPYYKSVLNSFEKPPSFIQKSKDDYNDILNNSKTVLGEYQFKRALFAKTFLFPEEWENITSFAFVREPTDRAISMFFFLFWKDLKHKLKVTYYTKKLLYNKSYAFDIFLDQIEMVRDSPTFYKPISLFFTTHTNPMWNDITDENEKVILSHIFKLEDLAEGVNKIFELCSIDKRIDSKAERLNVNRSRSQFTPNKKQLQRLQTIYASDYKLYETTQSIS